MQDGKNLGLNPRTLTIISHKLRTPLSIINGYSEAILSQSGKEKFSPFTAKAFDEINKQGSHMSLLLNKLINFNRVISTNIDELDKKPVALKPLIKENAAKAVSQEEEDTIISLPDEENSSIKRGTFVEIDCPEKMVLTANEEMMNLCVLELLANAIKFNNKMEKVIKVQVTNHGDSISLSVRDFGVGIRPQDVTNIFEPFYQVDDDFTGQINGWGLGLPMVKRILELHRGTVSVVSDRGLGSIFTVNFPIV
jgi:signal transduction histidine kinase